MTSDYGQTISKIKLKWLLAVERLSLIESIDCLSRKSPYHPHNDLESYCEAQWWRPIVESYYGLLSLSLESLHLKFYLDKISLPLSTSIRANQLKIDNKSELISPSSKSEFVFPSKYHCESHILFKCTLSRLPELAQIREIQASKVVSILEAFEGKV